MATEDSECTEGWPVVQEQLYAEPELHPHHLAAHTSSPREQRRKGPSTYDENHLCPLQLK